MGPAMMNAILLGAQAAGIGLDIYAQKQSRKAQALGLGIDEAETKLRMQEEELAFTQANTQNLYNLREVLSTQRAMMGARNQLPGVGSAKALETQSIGAYEQDIEARKLNKMFKSSQMAGLGRQAGISRALSRIESGNKLMASGMNMFSLNELMSLKPTGKATETKATATKGLPKGYKSGGK